MAEKITVADTDAIQKDLEYMTARWGELSEPAVFEVRAFKEGSQVKIARYDPEWIEEAVTWIEDLNALGHNVYVVRNPIRKSASGSASDDDIIASFFLWADCDDGEAASNVLRFGGPKWSAAVITGQTPSTRVHTYWQLQEPCTDMAAWRDMQVQISKHFGSDSTVVNPSRIMRVGGTVSYPAKHKIDRGYIKEVATLRTEYEEDRPPVTLDQMRRVFGETPNVGAKEGGITIATGEFAVLDREREMIKALSGENWNAAVFKLVGSYVRKGLSDGEIHALTDPLTTQGYTVQDTRTEVQAMVDRTRANPEFAADETAPVPPAPETQEEVDAVPPTPFGFWVHKDLSAIPYPKFVYSDFYARGYTSVTLAAPKVGKSMLGLTEAIDAATGLGILTGVQRKPLKVVYYNAEDDQDVVDSRVAALLTHYKIDQSAIEGRLAAVSGVAWDDFFLAAGQDGDINERAFVGLENFCKLHKPDVIIFDPLQDLHRSPETNEVFRFLGQRLRRFASDQGVALGLIHHTRKVAPGMTPSIDDMRGGSALRGTARFNRVLVAMSEDEAAKAGIENHRHYMRVGDMESNLAPPSSDVNRWFKKVSVETPAGVHVGAVEAWKWPDAFDGVTPQKAAQVRNAIDQMLEPPRADVRSAAWVGETVADVLGLNLTQKSDKARVKLLVAGWVKTDVLRITDGKDSRAGRSVQIVIAGSNDPLVSGGQAQ